MRTFPRWVVGLLVAGVLLLLAGATWYFNTQEHQVRDQVERELAAIGRLKADQISAWRRELLDEGADLMARPLLNERIAQWLAQPLARDRAALLAELQVIQAADDFVDILLVDGGGKILLSASGYTGTLHAEVIEELAVTLEVGEPHFTDLHSDPLEVRPHISMIAPLQSTARKGDLPAAALVLISDARTFLYPLIQTWPIPSNSAETLLVRRDGENVLFLNELRHRSATALQLRIPLTEVGAPAVQALVGATGVVEGKDYRGVDVIAYVQPIADSPWFMVSKVDSAEAMAAWRGSQLACSILHRVGRPDCSRRSLAVAAHQDATLQVPLPGRGRARASEQRHLVILNSIGDGVIATDAQARVTMLNPVAEALTGWTSSEAQGKPLAAVFTIVREETREPVATPVHRVLQEGVVVGMANHTVLIARDGVERPVADSAAPIRDDSGAISGVVLVFRDQTEERAARRALEQSEARNRAMVSAMPDLLFRIDRDFHYLDCQTSDLRRLFAPLEAFIGRKVRDVLPPEVAQIGEAAISQAFATGKPQVCEYVMNPPTGREWFELRVASINADEVLVIVREISDRHRAEELMRIRLHLLEFAVTHNLEELLQETLDRVGELVNSPVGFYHFFEPDQRTIALQSWSTRTLQEFCSAEGKGLHYDIDTAGVWADAVRTRTPVIHNNYAALSGRKGTPEGHALLVRELIVPVLRQDRVVAIMGVGNKPNDYNGQDVALVSYLADIAWEIAERQYAAESRRKAERIYRRAITSTGGVPYQRDYHDESYAFLGDGFDRLTGYTDAEMNGPLFTSRIRKVVPYGDFSDLSHQERIQLARQGKLTEYRSDYLFERKDGTLVWLADHSVPVYDDAGTPIAALGILLDVTQRKRAEEDHERLQAQLAQAQRLEAVGRLAGGVAHDFNNMLAVILMRVEMALRLIEPASPLRRHLLEIDKTAQRSVELTRQLLGYARKQTISPKPLDLNAAVANMLTMLQRLIGEDVDLIWQPGAQLWTVKMDPSQVDQILANLCVNARDAIAGTGRLIIKTENTVLDERYVANHPEMAPGAYVRMTVADNGGGMSKDTMQNIFEPFFTTKEQGKGTGLGLATVYGILQQNNGHIWVYSELGIGTTFMIYLPRVADELPGALPEAPADPPRGNGETVLLVEDELLVLEMGTEILEQLGYVVLPANSPGAALAALAANPGPVDLLITDVIMPEMNGRDLAARVAEVNPAIKRLFMSGYPADFIAHRGVLEAGVDFLQKPFSLSDLAFKVRAALDDRGGP